MLINQDCNFNINQRGGAEIGGMFSINNIGVE